LYHRETAFSIQPNLFTAKASAGAKKEILYFLFLLAAFASVAVKPSLNADCFPLDGIRPETV
jgi:hypothetical protein